MKSPFKMEKNLDTFYFIVAQLIDDEKYSEVLEFLNVSKDINRLIEHKVLSNENLYTSRILDRYPFFEKSK
jgi:3-phenylpropionate/cinnamic acid dioxygenase small subunit